MRVAGIRRGQREGGGAPPSRPGPLLEVTGLTISIPTEAGTIEAVRGVSFALQAG
jgi:ABC-type glutathione transport system ATPase component